MRVRAAVSPLVLAWALAACASSAAGTSAAPYAGQQSRGIKALSSEDVEGYLAGKGMGFAKAAELNGYPGPSHVLELASKLGLSEEQRSKTETLFRSMQARAAAAGRELVDAEGRLDQLFASRAVTPEAMSGTLSEIGALQAKLRSAHLEAHLAQVKILSATQVAEYVRLRGYESPPAPHEHRGHH